MGYPVKDCEHYQIPPIWMLHVYAGIISRSEVALIVRFPDGLWWPQRCVFVLKWATLNLEQVSEAAGWRQTGNHVCISSVLNGLEGDLSQPED